MTARNHKSWKKRADRLATRIIASALAYLMGAWPVMAQQPNVIIPDGRTQTQLQTSGNVTNITTTTVSGPNGFNSFSKFGVGAGNTVNLQLVKNAIAADFKIKGEGVREQPNAGERTKALLVKVPDLLPGGGTAEVSYIFGYHTKKLIQVSVSWSKATDEKMTPEQLFSNSSVLRAHFMTEGFKPESIASNMPIGGGLLIFRGSDAKDHTTMLILQGTFAQGENNQRVLTPASLLLFYVEDAKAPDVYRLPPGSF